MKFSYVATDAEGLKDETEITDGMMLKAAAPVFDYENNLIGVLYGGVLLNNNFEIVDKIKQTVFEELTYDVILREIERQAQQGPQQVSWSRTANLHLLKD